MTKMKEQQIRVLKNYIEKAISKAAEIKSNPFDNRLEKS